MFEYLQAFQAQSNLLFTIVAITAAILLLVALFMFGSAVFETVAAVVRFFIDGVAAILRFAGNSALAVGWYFMGMLLVIAAGGGWLAYVYWIKPGDTDLARVRPPLCTEVLDRGGSVLDYLCPFDGVRVWRPLEAVSTSLRLLVVMLEDDKFYEHGGLDVDEILNALQKDIEKQKLARGGSTITQQLAKNLFLTKEKSIMRKVSEVPLAMRLERELSKDQILELYLNTIEWGPGVYGVEAASRLYFDREASALREEEAWLLALMIPNPKELNLWVAPKAKKSLLKRAERMSHRLYLEHRMSKDEARAAFEKFSQFLDSWMTTRPVTYLSGRRYPARWSHNRNFTLAEVVSVRRGGAGLLTRFRAKPLNSTIDRAMQEKLELVQAGEHAHDLSNVLAVMEGSEIRGMIPVSNQKLLEVVKPLADAAGYRTQVFPARNIPASALWR